MSIRFLSKLVVVAGLIAIWSAPFETIVAQGSRIAPDLYSRLPWRHIGPEGNRISAVAGVAGQPLVYYAGLRVRRDPQDHRRRRDVGSGSSTNNRCIRSATSRWRRQTRASCGRAPAKRASAVTSRSAKASTSPPTPDARGRAWAWRRPAGIGKVIVHPKNPDVVLACALGHAYGPQQERGVYRTVDGGKNWERVLFVDENTGCSELDMDPTNPRKLFAGMWHVDIKTWARESGGPGSGLFTSNDGGSTWTRLRGQGLPTREVGKVKVAIAPSNPDRVYAMIETGDGVPWKGQDTDRGQVWRSEDGGRTWRVVSYDRNAMGRAHYYSHIFVSPDNENETYFLTASYSVSLDGGRDTRHAGRRRAPRRRPSRHVDRPRRRQPHDRRPRSGLLDLAEPRPHVAAKSAAERADVSRHRRQPDPLLRLRQQAGRPLVPGTEQQPSRRIRRRQRDSAQHVAHRGRRRERVGDARSGRIRT